MAIEYAGFIPTQPINWADLTEDLAGKIYQIGEKREKAKADLDQIAADNQKLLNSWEPGKNQTLNQLVLRGADQGRTLIKQWNDQLKRGEISPTDYKNKMNNLTENWGIFANSAKNYDARYEEVMKGQRDKSNSSFAVDTYAMFADMSDLSKMTTHVDNDGRVYMAKTDPATGKILGDIYDIRTMNLPENMVVRRVEVGTEVNELIEGWKPVSSPAVIDEFGKVNYDSVKNQDEYKIMVESVVNTIAPDSNPRAQISVLVDNGVIPAADYYTNKDEYQAKRNQAIESKIQLKRQAGIKDVNLTAEELKQIDLSLVQVTQDKKGVIIPVLTEEQRKAVKERVRNEVDIRIEERIEKDLPRYTSNTTSTKTPKEGDFTQYAAMFDAWNSGDIDRLNSFLVNDKYRIETVPGVGRRIIEYVKDPNSKTPKKKVVFNATDNLSDLIPYFYSNTNTGLKQRDAWLKATGGAPAGTGGNQSLGAGDSIFKKP